MPSKIQTMPTISSSDPVLETQFLWAKYKKIVLVALILIVLGVSAWGAYRIMNERRDAAAAKELAAATTPADFQKVITQFQGTPASSSAYLFLAEQQRKDKKFEEATGTLQSFVDKFPKHELRGTARLTIAANLESLGKTDEALASYQRLATDDPQGFVAPLALISQVHLLKDKGKIEDARKACETIQTQYRDSVVANEASRQLALMKPANPAGKMLQLPPQTLNPNSAAAPNIKTEAPPQAVPGGPPGAAPKPPTEPKKP